MESDMKLRFLFWNLNDPRPDTRPGFEHIDHVFSGFYYPSRVDMILSDIEKINPEFLSSFELRVDNMNRMMAKLHDLGYSSESMSYAPNQYPDNSFYFINAWKNNSALELISVHRLWFTSTPEVPLNIEKRKTDQILIDNKEEFEKGTLICKYKIKANGKTLIHCVNHFPLRAQYQKTCGELLSKLLAELKGDIVIVGGDFNTFPTEVERWDSTITIPLSRVGVKRIAYDNISFQAFPCDLGFAIKPELAKECHGLANKMFKDGTSHGEIRKLYVDYTYRMHGGPLVSVLDHIFCSGAECVLDHSSNDTSPFGNFDQQVSGTPTSPSDHACMSGYLLI